MSLWYTLQVTVTNGTSPTSPVDFFFTTPNTGVEPRTITGLYESPYEGTDILIDNPGGGSTVPTYNATNGEIQNLFFLSPKLLAAFAASSNPPANVASTDYFRLFYSNAAIANVVEGCSADNGPFYGQRGISSAGPVADPSCFNEGTKILCLNKELVEEYIAIEKLRKGDLVKCYKGGYRRIDLIGKGIMINNPEKWHGCMWKMSKSGENGLIEDLIVTGGHALLVDDLGDLKEETVNKLGSLQMIDGKYLLLASVSSSFVKLENKEVYTYYHFAVENDGDDDSRYGVWGNGVLTETPSKNQFVGHKYEIIE